MSSLGLEGLETVRRYLKEHDWQAEELEGEYAFKAQREGELCPLTYYFQVKVDLEEFLFYIAPDISLLPDMLPAVAEFIARANFGMRIGCFELDYREGRPCFRSSVRFKGDRLSPALVDGVIQPALTAFDEFFPGMAQVIAGLETPTKAIAKIEYGTE